MSLATEFAPSVRIPASARLDRGLAVVPDGLSEPWPAGPQREYLATVAVLRAPTDAGVPALRLTRRGVVVLAGAVALLGAGLVWLAAASAPSAAPAQSPGAGIVTVQSGDTLWSIASRVAPDRDPREEITILQSRNRLTGVALVPGQQLRVR